jgi:hypothetical protein
MTSSPPRDSLKWENIGDFSAESKRGRERRRERGKGGTKERKREGER